MTRSKSGFRAKSFLKRLLIGTSLSAMAFCSPAIAELDLPSVGKQGCRKLEMTLFVGSSLRQGAPFGVPLADWTEADFDQLRSVMAACNRFVFSDSASELRQAQAQTGSWIDKLEKELEKEKDSEDRAAARRQEAEEAAERKKKADAVLIEESQAAATTQNRKMSESATRWREAEAASEATLKRANEIISDTKLTADERISLIDSISANFTEVSNQFADDGTSSIISTTKSQLANYKNTASEQALREKRAQTLKAECSQLLSTAGISEDITNSKIVPDFGSGPTVGQYLCPFLKAEDGSSISVDASTSSIQVEFGENELRFERRQVRDGFWRSSPADTSQPFVPVYGRMGQQEAHINNGAIGSVFMGAALKYLFEKYGPSVLE